MDKTIRVSDDLKLPAADLVESAIGIIGKRGKGKTGLVKVLAEELVRVGLPFVWLDPIGIAWGLKSSFDGKGPGLEVLVVGGLHGDVRLDRRGGAEVARSIIEANVSAVIDFSQESKGAYREFVRDFAHELYRSNNSSRLVIVEEAPELVPQRIRPDMGDVFEAVERLVSRGRNNAIGVVLVSQRSATINKDVLSEIDALFVFGLVSPQDRKALKEWVEAHGAEAKLKTFDDGIASLAKRECWAWSPEAFGGFFKKIYVSDFHTFHPDKTHLRRLGLLEVKPVTTDVSAIVLKLGAKMELLAKEKTETAEIPKLRARLARAEKELEHLRSSPGKLNEKLHDAGSQMRELARAKNDRIDALTADVRARGQEISELRRSLKNSQAWIERAKKFARTIAEIPEPEVPKSPPPPRTSVQTTETPRRESAPREFQRVEAPDPGTDDIQLKAGAVRMLRELASRHPMVLTRAQLGTLAGFTPSGGTFQTYFSQLKRLGYLEEDGQGTVRVTDPGLAFVGEVPPAPSTHDEIMSRWKQSLKRGAGEMLQVVVDERVITKEDLAERTGFTASGGTFQTYLSILRRNGLVEVQDDTVRATEVLFP